MSVRNDKPRFARKTVIGVGIVLSCGGFIAFATPAMAATPTTTATPAVSSAATPSATSSSAAPVSQTAATDSTATSSDPSTTSPASGQPADSTTTSSPADPQASTSTGTSSQGSTASTTASGNGSAAGTDTGASSGSTTPTATQSGQPTTGDSGQGTATGNGSSKGSGSGDTSGTGPSKGSGSGGGDSTPVSAYKLFSNQTVFDLWLVNGTDISNNAAVFNKPQQFVTSVKSDSTDLAVGKSLVLGSTEAGKCYQLDAYKDSSITLKFGPGSKLYGPDQPQEDLLTGSSYKLFCIPAVVTPPPFVPTWDFTTAGASVCIVPKGAQVGYVQIGIAVENTGTVPLTFTLNRPLDTKGVQKQTVAPGAPYVFVVDTSAHSVDAGTASLTVAQENNGTWYTEPATDAGLTVDYPKLVCPVSTVPVNPTPTPTPTPTPAPSKTPAPTPSATPTATPAPAVVVASDNTPKSGTLAFTGSNAEVPAGIAGALLAAGGALVVIARRRRLAQDAQGTPDNLS